jgi:hypothetical protein
MNMLSFCIAPLVLAAAPIRAVPASMPTDPVLRALQAQDDVSLGALRGGAPETRIALGVDELTALRAADAAGTDLADLRGGELDNHDLTVIAVVALAVIALVLIL